MQESDPRIDVQMTALKKGEQPGEAGEKVGKSPEERSQEISVLIQAGQSEGMIGESCPPSRANSEASTSEADLQRYGLHSAIQRVTDALTSS